jgi:ferritin-like protein
MSSESYHEPIELLSDDTKDMHRALVSLREELEAVDWYQQRAEACTDKDLAAVLVHNKNEEIEHAMMTLEWIRRHNSVFGKNLDMYLNTTGPITEVEKKAKGGGGGSGGKAGDDDDKAPSVSNDLGIGSLKGKR